MQKLNRFAVILFVFVSSLAALAATPFQPTTTLAAETGNNTSAAASFATQTNGNIAGANISKVPMRSLLYPGSTSKIFAHFVPWFGFGDHMNVGYNSNDVAQVQRQVADMTSRGFDGVVIDWYGRGTLNHNFVFYDQATQDMMREAEQHNGFTFAIMEDVGALKACTTAPGCNVTQTMIDDLNYANTTYWNSPAYLHFNGRPVVYFFGEEAYSIDWNLARSSIAGNPVFVFRNAGGFSYLQAGGGYSWLEPTIPGMTYLDGFYSAAGGFPADYVTGSAYKGFNDALAAWTAHRFTPQNCGQTWLSSVAEAGKYYSAGKQLFGIQLVTWNDYEEGTEIETGIDNCVAVNASVSGTVAHWNITGQLNTIDHFSIYASQDGTNLMWLADEGTNVSSTDLAQFGLPAGNYTVFVKAVGKPSLTNKMSGGASVTLAGGPGASADFSISAPSGSSTTVKAGQTAAYNLQLSATGAAATVTVSCTGAPPNAACVGPASDVTVNPGAPTSVPISVTTTAKKAAAAPPPGANQQPPAPWFPPSFMPLASIAGIASLLTWLLRGKLGAQPPSAAVRRRPGFAAPVVLLAGLAVIAGCGGTASSMKSSPTPTPTPVPTASGTPAGAYTLTVTASSGNVTKTQQLTLTVQ